MKVVVRYFATARKVTGKGVEELALDDDSTVETLLQRLSQMYGRSFTENIYDDKLKAPRGNLQFLIDGRNVKTLKQAETRLHDGCRFSIIPPLRGGANARS